MTSVEPTAFEVSAPFRNPKADLVVKSSDGAEFRVWKSILAEGSGFFAGMFECAQPSDFDEPILWPEPAETVDVLLHYIYPILKPKMETVEELIRFIRAADKWQIELAVWMLKKELILPRFLDAEPLRVYAFACEMGYHKTQQYSMTKAAAVDPCNPKYRSQLEGMPALDFLRLVKYRKDSRVAFDNWFTAPSSTSRHEPDEIPDPAFLRQESDVTMQSSDGVDFRLLKAFLSAASPRLAALLQDSKGEEPTISWLQPAETIDFLLHFVYPVVRPTLSTYSVDQIMTLLNAAHRWEIGAAAEPLLAELISPERLANHALKIYGFCGAMNFKKEKSIAKRYALRSDPLRHSVREDFMDLTAVELVDLWEKRNQCVKAMSETIRTTSFPSFSSRSCAYHTDYARNAESLFKDFLISTMHETLDTEPLSNPRFLARFVFGSQTCRQCMTRGSVLELGNAENVLKTLKEKLDDIISAVL